MNLAQTIRTEDAPEIPVLGARTGLSYWVARTERLPVVDFDRKVEPAEVLGFRAGTVPAKIYSAILAKGRAMTIPELRDALPEVKTSTLKQTLVWMKNERKIARSGFCKSYRYGLPRRGR